MNTNPGHLTEFWDGYTGTCGECAEEVAFAAADGRQDSEAEMVANTRDMDARHLLLAHNGETTLHNLATYARDRGYEVLIEWDYAEPFPHDWHQVILEHAGKNPIILQHARGRYLIDQETGARDEATLNYHFTAIINKQADGYIENDGDNPQVRSRYQVYSYDTLNRSGICGLLVIKAKENNQVGGVPKGWKDDGTTLTAPNGQSVLTAKRAYILEHAWDPNNQPCEDAQGIPGGGSYQIFDYGQLVWDGKAVTLQPTGAELVKALKTPPPPPPAIPPSVPVALQAAQAFLSPYVALAKEVDQAISDLK